MKRAATWLTPPRLTLIRIGASTKKTFTTFGYSLVDRHPHRPQRPHQRPLQQLRQRLQLRRQRHLRQLRQRPLLLRRLRLPHRRQDLLLLRDLFPRQGGGPLPCRDLSCSRDRRSRQQSQRWIGFSEVDGKTLAEGASSGGGAAITFSTRWGQRVPPTHLRSVCENAFTLGELLPAADQEGSYRRQRTKRRTTSLPSFPSVKEICGRTSCRDSRDPQINSRQHRDLRLRTAPAKRFEIRES
jgi:hypothetical protein